MILGGSFIEDSLVVFFFIENSPTQLPPPPLGINSSLQTPIPSPLNIPLPPKQTWDI